MLSLLEKITLTYWCCCLLAGKIDRRRKKLIDLGAARLVKVLDTRTILRLQQNVRTLLRLEYGKPARQLMRLQRRQTVLEPDKQPSSSEATSDEDKVCK